MKMTVAVRLLRLLNARPERALTAKQIAEKWRAEVGSVPDPRYFQRYMSELLSESDGPALVNVVDGESIPRYYLRMSQVALWFMTEEAALETLLTQRLMNRTFGALSPEEAEKRAYMAEILADESIRTRRLRDRLRIVPDGIGRQPAEIDKKVLVAAINAVAEGKRLDFSYVTAAGKSSDKKLNPLGLVAKDGTIYLVATRGLSDQPINYALQRFKDARVSADAMDERLGFDLDCYIDETHQLSHVLDLAEAPVGLKLRVSQTSIFHFKERPLSGDQVIGPVTELNGWHIVTATVPNTLLLVPFLLSMGPRVEVLEPAHVREKTFQWVRDTCALYEVEPKA